MASLVGQQLKDTYDSLLKTSDNDALGGTYKEITDGSGNGSGLYLGTGGNVGIGTTSPDEKLFVSGTDCAIAVGASNTSGVAQLSLKPIGSDGSSVGDAVIKGVPEGADKATAMTFTTRASDGTRTEYMRIDSSGNVGIGETNPAYILHANGKNENFIAKFQSVDDKASILIEDDDTLNYIHSQDGYLSLGGESGLDAGNLNINSTNGNVGIGTTSPDALIHIVSNNDGNNNNVVLRFEDTDGNTGTNQPLGQIQFYGNDSSGAGEGIKASINAFSRDNQGKSYLTFSTSDDTTNNQERMRIDKDGNVGIGTTSPSEKLDVDGDAVINGITVGRGLADVSSNTVVGNDALSSNTTGSLNTAVGLNALRDNTTGSENTAIGRTALVNNTTGGYNTALGRSALNSNTTGSGNIGIGFITDAGAYDPVFNPSTEDNRLVAGHTAITNAYVQVAWTVVSDARDKTNIEDVDLGLDFVTKLNPKQFQFKKSREDETPNGKKRYGFLAQDILELEGDNPVIIDNEDEDKLKYNGESLVPILVNAIKELKAEIEQLKNQ